MKVLLGITGGIAAYKAAEIIRLLTESGNEVRVVPTENALRFIGKTTLEALSHNVVDAGLYTDVESVKHIELGHWADVVLVAPATASFLARTAAGIADDLLGNVLLATQARVVLAPAMHTEMWLNEATTANVEALRSRGIEVIEPSSGRLTGADTGIGRLPEPSEIVSALSKPKPLSGKHLVVTAGGTREPIDPVRYIGNYSSGKQGLAIAESALALGARVTLISCNLDSQPHGMKTIRVETALELLDAVNTAIVDADAIVMCAAVADYRVLEPAEFKLKKDKVGEELQLKLVANPDILASIERVGLLKIGFAAETTHQLEEAAKKKLLSKGSHLLVANDVSGSAVFGASENTVLILQDSGESERVSGSKREVADALLATITKRLA